MSDTNNPYQSPAAEPSLATGAAPSGLTLTTLGYLKEASPWLRFVGILGFIGAGLIALFGVIIMFVMPYIPKADLGSMATLFSGLVGGVGLVYIAMGALYFFPALFTYRFGVKLRDYGQGGADADLELAFRNNKSYWKFQGILLIVLLSLIALFLLVAIVVGIISVAH
jgi:hypothetical protein